MSLRPVAFAATLVAAGNAFAAAPAAEQLLADWHEKTGTAFSVAAGESLWQRSVAVDGDNRRCGTCHGDDLTRPGKHARTGKPIEPLAPSVNPKRFTEVREMEKWFLRNCKWTFGRECSAQEKGDLLTYLLTK